MHSRPVHSTDRAEWTYRKSKSPFRPVPLAARFRPTLARGDCRDPSAPRQPAGVARSKVERGVARLWLVLGMRLRMGEGRASGVSWSEDLGKGVGGIRLTASASPAYTLAPTEPGE
jgi:hypothetical protein